MRHEGRRPRRQRFFALLLRLFPAEFRGDFGADMEADFADQARDAARAGPRATARLWWRTLPSMLRTGAAQHGAAFVQDARFALRSMARTPGFTAAAVLMIALGTGANAAMFSVIDAIMLRSPFPDPSRLVIVRVTGADGRTTAAMSLDHYRALSETATPFAAVGAIGGGLRPILTGFGETRRLNVECVTAGMFRALGTPPAAGRTFTGEEDRRGGPSAIAISDEFWRREMGADPAAVGRVLTLNGTASTIVGIMPRGFGGPYSRNNNDGWMPLGAALGGTPTAGCAAASAVNVIARLRPDVTLDDAALSATASAGIPQLDDSERHTGARLSLLPLGEQTLFEVRTPLLALLGAVALVLLIACANVANLQLERVFGRRAELSIRMALGASRGRLVRQILTENVMLYVCGALAGAFAARATTGLIVGLLPAYVPHLNDIRIDARVLALTLALACVAALVSGAVPAVHASRAAVMNDLRVSARTATRGGDWTRRALVVAQIALSLTLIVGAALMIRTFLALRPAAPGFSAADKLTGAVRLQGAAAATPQRFFGSLFDRLRTVAGVRSVSGSTYLPMSGNVSTRRVSVNGAAASVYSGVVTPDYFGDMDIPVVSGRGFTAADDAGAPPVAIVNEAFARKLFERTSPLGATIEVERATGSGRDAPQIVGVIRDTRSAGSDLKARPEIYFPFAQTPGPFLNVIVRADNPRDPRLAAGIRAATATLDAAQVVDRIEPMQAMLDSRVATPRFGAWLLGAFAAVALLLTAIGVAASIAWWVSQQTREIGVRVALGAPPAAVTHTFLRQGLALTLSGVVLGLGGAAATTRLLDDWLFGVTPLDPATFAASAAAILVIGAAASYLPARRAARVDPLVALRAE